MKTPVGLWIDHREALIVTCHESKNLRRRVAQRARRKVTRDTPRGTNKQFPEALSEPSDSGDAYEHAGSTVGVGQATGVRGYSAFGHPLHYSLLSVINR